MENKPTLIVIIGPTAVGKTSLSIKIAKEFGAEIFSSDSRQFYKELNIGTAKPNAKELSEAKHHFISNLNISEEYNATKYEKEALKALDIYFKTNKIAILCGGSGMYVNALIDGFDEDLPTADEKLRIELKQQLEEDGILSLQKELKNLDPEYFATVDQQNSKRLIRAIEVCKLSGKKYSELRKGKKRKRNFNVIKIGLEMERPTLYARINSRVDKMIEQGLIDEAKSVLPFRMHNALKTVGYIELFDFFDGNKTLEESIEKIKVNSRRYAKRQLTWFKKDKDIKWFQQNDKTEIIQYIRNRI